MSGTTSIRCPNCQTITSNSDYCSNCGEIINVHLRRKLERENKEQQKLEEVREKPPGKLSTIFKSVLEHPNVLVRSVAKGMFSVWVFLGLLVGVIISGAIALVSG